ncbi:MAG: hypothetical protein WED09_05445 [Homoserinimonas sp.]
MNTHELDGLVPAQVSPDDWHNLVLGHDRYGQPAGINLRHGAHSRIVGSLKTIALQRLAISALSRGNEVVWIDTQSAEVGRLRPWLKEVATTPAEAGRSLIWLLREVGRRQDLMTLWNVSCWRDLPRSMNLSPITVLVDNFNQLIQRGRSLEEALTSPRRSVKRRNAFAQFSASYHLQRLMSETESTGIHLVVADDAASALQVPPSILSHISTQVLAPRPTDASGHLIGALFPGAEAEVVKAICDLGEARGVMLIGTRKGVSAVRLSASLSAEAPVILSEIGVPKHSNRST